MFLVILSYLIGAFVKPNLQVWIIDRKMFISRFRIKIEWQNASSAFAIAIIS